ncbi:MAG: hypothetical protein ACFFD6_10925, partial [Candidatus Thorarchaeota archaeon]
MNAKPDSSPRGVVVGLVVLALSILGPVNIAMDQVASRVAVSSVFWFFNYGVIGFRFTSDAELYINALLIIPRYVFAYWVYRYYENKTTMGKLIVVGFLGEIPAVAFGILVTLVPYNFLV